MNERIVVRFDPVEGAVVRILGLIERRGFELRGLVMEADGDEASLTIDVEARDPSRRLDVLDLQLRRLHEVRGVSCITPALS